MSDKDFLAHLNIASPCTADWKSMTGSDQIRFCQHCQLSVHDLSEMTNKQFRRLIAKSDGRLCVRYSRPDTIVPPVSTTGIFHRIGRRTSMIAAGAFTASLGLSTAVAGLPLKEAAPGHSPTAVCSTEPAIFRSEGGTITGTIFDPNGAVISGAIVALSSAELKLATRTSTNDQGQYRFDGLEPGTYNLKIEAEGFGTSDLPNIVLRANDESRFDQTLSIATIQAEVEIDSQTRERHVMMGAVAVSSPREPLVKAAQEDDLDTVKEVLLTKRDANVRDKGTDSTALEHAVLNANREMVQVLLWAGADVNAKDANGQTVLMMLGEKITADIVWDLINAGAKVNLRDNDGDTALIATARSNNVEVLKTLLDAGAKVNAKNNNGETALMLAASGGLVNNIRTLLLGGAEVNARDKEGKSAFNRAKEDDHGPAMRLLRSYGADETEAPKTKAADEKEG